MAKELENHEKIALMTIAAQTRRNEPTHIVKMYEEMLRTIMKETKQEV